MYNKREIYDIIIIYEKLNEFLSSSTSIEDKVEIATAVYDKLNEHGLVSKYYKNENFYGLVGYICLYTNNDINRIYEVFEHIFETSLNEEFESVLNFSNWSKIDGFIRFILKHIDIDDIGKEFTDITDFYIYDLFISANYDFDIINEVYDFVIEYPEEAKEFLKENDYDLKKLVNYFATIR